MDQKSTNGNGTDKRNWRERLGIGTKDMPKISDEFKAQPALTVPPKSRPPQAVSRPAPMAPRAVTAKPAAPPAETLSAPPPPPSVGLADKLRAQRAAAEKLAEQRVTAARERAESRSAAEPSLPMPRPAPVEAAPKPAQPAANRPKFTFADDETSISRRDLGSDLARSRLQRSAGSTAAAGSLLPPRPALGGERASLRAPSSSFRAEALPSYRPIDPATGYVPPSARPTLGGQRPYSAEPPETGYGDRLPARPPVYDTRRRLPPANPPYETDGYDEDLRGEPRLGRTAAPRGRARAYAEEPDDVFEDEAAEAPRRRASASDYHSAYREAEEGYEVDRRRSSGPWLLLLALLAAAMATGGIVWYYNTKMKTASVATTAPATETVPVVAAPVLPAKTVPETAAEPAIEAASVNKKEIYDRIVGDQEVLGGQIVPTEVTPVQPEVQSTGEQGAAQVPQPTDVTGQGSDEPLPLPLPPPPGDDSTQGQLEPGTDQSVAAAAEPAGSELKSKATTEAGESITSLLPPQDITGGAADTSEMATDSEPEAADPAAAAKPAKKKAASSAKSKKATTETEAATGSGVEPLVLVPPGDVAAPSQAATDSAAPLIGEPVQPAPKKKKTLFDLFKKGDTSEPAADVAAQEKIVNVEPAPVETNVASLPATKTEAAPSSGGGGYVVQLASFRSEAEAQAEYQRLKFKYPSLIGPLPSRIAQATVAGSTRYRLGVGPLASKDEATKVCGNLFAAGERDCLVRTP